MGASHSECLSTGQSAVSRAPVCASFCCQAKGQKDEIEALFAVIKFCRFETVFVMKKKSFPIAVSTTHGYVVCVWASSCQQHSALAAHGSFWTPMTSMKRPTSSHSFLLLLMNFLSALHFITFAACLSLQWIQPPSLQLTCLRVLFVLCIKCHLLGYLLVGDRDPVVNNKDEHPCPPDGVSIMISPMEVFLFQLQHTDPILCGSWHTFDFMLRRPTWIKETAKCKNVQTKHHDSCGGQTHMQSHACHQSMSVLEGGHLEMNLLFVKNPTEWKFNSRILKWVQSSHIKQVLVVAS